MYLWLIHADVRHPQAVLCMLIIECCFIVIVTEHIFYTQRMCALACMYIYMSVACRNLERVKFYRLINRYFIISQVSMSLCFFHCLPANGVSQICLPAGLSRSLASGKHWQTARKLKGMGKTVVRAFFLGQHFPGAEPLVPSSSGNSHYVSSSLWIELAQVLEKAMAPHSSTLAWKIPWREEPGRLQSMGSLRVGHN